MKQKEEEVLTIFRESGALLEGHFLLRSGLHSAHFFQCAQVCQYIDKVTRLAEMMVKDLKGYGHHRSRPCYGWARIGQECSSARHSVYFFEKVDDRLELRRNFKFEPGEKVLIVEDVITRETRR